MPLGLAVLLAVLVVTAVVSTFAYLIEKSAERHDQEGRQ